MSDAARGPSDDAGHGAVGPDGVFAFEKRPMLTMLACGLVFAGLMSLHFRVPNTPLALVIPVLPMFAAWVLARWKPARRARLLKIAGLLLFAAGTSVTFAEQQLYIARTTPAGFVPQCLLLGIYESTRVGVLALVFSRLPGVSKALAGALAWSAIEWLRGRVAFDGYSWFVLSQPSDAWVWLGMAPVVGQYGVSFIMALIGTTIATLAGGVYLDRVGVARGDSTRKRTRTLRRAAALAASSLLVWSVHQIRWATTQRDGPVVRAAVVQTNVPQDRKLAWEPEERERLFEAWARLTAEAAVGKSGFTAGRPALIVWPETMYPGGFLEPYEMAMPGGGTRRVYQSDLTNLLLAMQQRLGVPLVIGAMGVDGLRLDPSDPTRLTWDDRYNSVYLVRGGRIEEPRYDKMQLTPFGEVMPYISNWTWLETQLLAIGASGMTFDLGAGKVSRVFKVANRAGAADNAGAGQMGTEPTAASPSEVFQEVRFVTPICFEVTWPDLCRRMVYEPGPLWSSLGGGDRRADLMVCLSNDGWFWDQDRGRELHLMHARWRCAELGTPMVRSANEGVSAFIDADGLIVARGVNGSSGTDEYGHRVEGVLSGEVRMRGGRTVYSRIGDLVPWGSFVLTGVLGVVALARRRDASISGITALATQDA